MSIKLWGVVPAAGVGARMNSSLPKQYLRLAGQTILDISVKKLLTLPQLEAVMVACSSGDTYFDLTELPRINRVERCIGGEERWLSVLNGLDALISSKNAANEDWVLVHDAARPCVSHGSLVALSRLAGCVPVGAILACPVADTLKYIEVGKTLINKTVARKHLWQAHTPQMFPLLLLKNALLYAKTKGLVVTDESSAVEYYLATAECSTIGDNVDRDAKVQVVADRRDNIKVTHSEDLVVAQAILMQQGAI